MTNLESFKKDVESLKNINRLEAIKVDLEADDISLKHEDAYTAMQAELARANDNHHAIVQHYLENITAIQDQRKTELATASTGTIAGFSFRASRMLRSFEMDLISEYRTEASNTLRDIEKKLLTSHDLARTRHIVFETSPVETFPFDNAWHPTDRAGLEVLRAHADIEHLEIDEATFDPWKNIPKPKHNAQTIPFKETLRPVQGGDTAVLTEHPVTAASIPVLQEAQAQTAKAPAPTIYLALTKAGGEAEYLAFVNEQLSTLKGQALSDFTVNKLSIDRGIILQRLEMKWNKTGPLTQQEFQQETRTLSRLDKALQSSINTAMLTLSNDFVPSAGITTRPESVAEIKAVHMKRPSATPPANVPVVNIPIVSPQAHGNNGLLLRQKSGQQETPAPANANLFTPKIYSKDNKDLMELARSNDPETRYELLKMIQFQRDEALQQFEDNKKNGASLEENRHVFEQIEFLRARAGEVRAGLDRDRRAAKAAHRLELATQANAEPAEISFLKPEKKSLFSRLKDSVSSAVTSVKDTFTKIAESPKTYKVMARLVMGAGAVGIAAGVMHMTDDKTDPVVSKNTAEAAYKIAPLPITENAFTVIVPPDAKAAAPAATTPASAEPAVKAASTVEPILKAAPAKTARADFSAKAVETYKMPDDLKVTFNDGSTSRFDKETWKKVCDQLKSTGSTGPACDELAMK